jgi:hypothetical protein
LVDTPATRAEPAVAPATRDWSASLWFLVGVNLLPIVGVLKFGWDVGDIVFLYWFENLIIGALNVVRILLAQPATPFGVSLPAGTQLPPGFGAAVGAIKYFMAPFFAVHYGFFCYGHGMFLASMFHKGRDTIEMTRSMLHEPAMLVAVAALAASHLFSLIRNYIGRGEYRRVDLSKLMFRPYGRIMVVHVYILAAGFALQFYKSPAIAIVAFVLVKIVVDAAMHRRERALHA